MKNKNHATIYKAGPLLFDDILTSARNLQI